MEKMYMNTFDVMRGDSVVNTWPSFEDAKAAANDLTAKLFADLIADGWDARLDTSDEVHAILMRSFDEDPYGEYDHYDGYYIVQKLEEIPPEEYLGL